MIYKKELERITELLQEQKTDLVDELGDLPKGRLLCYKSHGVTCYSERFPATGNAKKERRQGVKSDSDYLMKLVRKECVVRMIPRLEKDIVLLEKLMRSYEPADENSVMSDIVAKYEEISGYIYNQEVDSREWANTASGESDYHKEDLTSIAADGSHRRSLGEIIIGSRLSHYNIPFKYEAAINHPDIPYIPDFTIKRPSDGKIIYWEHFGKVNDVNYMQNNKQKLDTYERYGIVPWENLIISYSRSDYSINEKLIDALIQGWLL